jgi:hypothetical protein
MYPQKVIALFEKNIDVSKNDCLSYETRLADEWGHEDDVSVTLEINDLINKELVDDWWVTHQPNALKLFQSKTAKLIMFYGLADGASKDTKQEITISKSGDAFILWKVESLEFLNGVADALTRKGKVWIKLDLFCDDSYFDDYENTNSYSINLYKISINFADS